MARHTVRQAVVRCQVKDGQLPVKDVSARVRLCGPSTRVGDALDEGSLVVELGGYQVAFEAAEIRKVING